MKGRLLFRCVQIVLAATFVTAAVMKLKEPQSFAASVATFRAIPRSWSNIVAICLPSVELFCGVLLFVKGWQRSAALGLVFLNVAFIALLAQGVFRGLDLDCGCFGKWDPAAGHPAVAISRDIVLLVLAVYFYLALGANSRPQLPTMPRSEMATATSN